MGWSRKFGPPASLPVFRMTPLHAHPTPVHQCCFWVSSRGRHCVSHEDLFPNFSSKNPRRLNSLWAQPGTCKRGPTALCGASGGLWLTDCVTPWLSSLPWIIGRDSCGVVCSPSDAPGPTLVPTWHSSTGGSLTRAFHRRCSSAWNTPPVLFFNCLPTPPFLKAFVWSPGPQSLLWLRVPDLGHTVLDFLQMAPDLEPSVWLTIFLFVFGFMLVWKWYASSRNHSLVWWVTFPPAMPSCDCKPRFCVVPAWGMPPC